MSQEKTHPPEAGETREPLPTIWSVTAPMWNNVFQPLLAELDPPSRMGRPAPTSAGAWTA